MPRLQSSVLNAIARPQFLADIHEFLIANGVTRPAGCDESVNYRCRIAENGKVRPHADHATAHDIGDVVGQNWHGP